MNLSEFRTDFALRAIFKRSVEESLAKLPGERKSQFLAF